MQLNYFKNKYIKDSIPSLIIPIRGLEDILKVVKRHNKKIFINKIDGKNNAGLINTWVLKEDYNGNKYLADNIEKNKFLFLDYDYPKNGRVVINPRKYYEIKEILEENNYRYIMYKTSSYTEENQSFRVILELDDYYHKDDISLLRDYLEYRFEFSSTTLDRSSFDIGRKFVLPYNNADIDYNINGNYYGIFNDNDRDIIKRPKHIGELKSLVERKLEAEREIKDKISNNSYDASNNSKVLYYLNTSFLKQKGNGDSNYSLFVALSICYNANDEATMEKVKQKALDEGWTHKEINYKLKCIRKY